MEFRVWMFGNEKATVKVVDSKDIPNEAIILSSEAIDGNDQDNRIVAAYYVSQYVVHECGETFICINSEFDVYYVQSCNCSEKFLTRCHKIDYKEAKDYLIENGKLN